jgi:nitrile hydratase
VARCWLDSAFKARLLADANSAIAEMGMQGSNGTASTKLTAVENVPGIHNVIVCTLCSCYPLSILGLSPPWYKSRAYRARMVRQPRQVLAEFGTVIPPDVSIRVHDSTADLRYIVIPERPPGTEGWDEGQLQALVTRDSMIGTRRIECEYNE